ncbi:MAG TPA: hypothetical protein VNI61_10305, partial [Gemmatimonadales bacterium]|nr:hypothetical protein [Gemmatimonadales bacterium]
MTADRFPRAGAPAARLVATLLLLLGCAMGPRTPAVRPVTAAATTGRIEDIVRRAVALDAARDPGADSLFAPDALVVANARVRLGAPRFAGVGSGGRVT